MDQLALPYRIGLVAILAAAAVWFVALRPKVNAEPAPEPAVATAPGTTGLATAVDKARDAVATSTTSAAATEAAANAVGDPAGATGTAGSAVTQARALATAKARTAATARAKATAAKAKATAQKKAEAVAATKAKGLPTDLSDPILAQVAKGTIAVVLFYDKRSADDRATARSVRLATAHRKKVDVKLVPMKQLGRYTAITKGVSVSQSPTLVVIGKGERASSIVGYADDRAVTQAINDARTRGASKKTT